MATGGHGAPPIEPVVALSASSADGGGFAAAGGVTMVTWTGTGPDTRATSFLPKGSWRAPVAKRGSVASTKDCESALMGQAASIRDLGVVT
jgi:alkanesulfonate monooxygenase SsuD/methylene tetrahydromethanopterin reductase-like flavin-dependent oxidoreductase (luciferase family)